MLARQLVPWARSFIPPMEASAGLINQARLRCFRWRTFPLAMQTTEQLLATLELSSTQPTLAGRGLAKRARRPTLSWVSPFPMPIPGRRSVNSAQYYGQPIEGRIGRYSTAEQEPISGPWILPTRIMGQRRVTAAPSLLQSMEETTG